MTIESYLPPNCVKDGSVDYTSYLQKAINAAEQVLAIMTKKTTVNKDANYNLSF